MSVNLNRCPRCGNTETPDECLNLVGIAIDLHMYHSGANDSYTPETQARHTRILRGHVANWRPSTPRTEKFDRAVFALLVAVLAEVS